MLHNSLLKHILIACFAFLFVSCDKDFNEIGSDVIGDDHYGLVKDDTKSIVAYNQNLGAMQSNNLPINALGYYNNPFFGKTKASLVSQVVLDTLNQTIGANPTVTKVELSLPYFSRIVSTDATTGDRTFELDSIYGSNKFKLSVYESTYFLRDFDASTGFQEAQKYYSDATPDFDANKNAARLNDDSSVSQNDEFYYSDKEIVTYKIVDGVQVVDTRSAPGMRLNLKKQFFQDKLFSGNASGKLVNNTIFKEYFRGLYFKTESASSSPSQGSLALLNFKLGKIIVTYTVSVTDGNNVTTTKEKKLAISLGGNTVNLFENDYNSNYQNNVTTNVDKVNGDSRLYLKGGAGSMAVISLFGATDIKGYDANGAITGPNGVSDELDDLRNPTSGQKWLVNDASLSFYIDQQTMGTSPEPKRIYLYDLNNNRPLLDYFTDISTVVSNPKNNKFVHGGLVENETTGDKRGVRYKIRITNHLRNLINKDSTNVKLGLVVTEAIGIVSNLKLKTPVIAGIPLDRAPLSSVVNPLGTVLFGNTIPSSSSDYDKRLKLEIYYTKPN
jgi:hypothetical protein